MSDFDFVFDRCFFCVVADIDNEFTDFRLFFVCSAKVSRIMHCIVMVVDVQWSLDSGGILKIS